MQVTQKLFFSFLCFFFYTNFANQSATDFDFDAMDNAMTTSGIDQTIQTKVPSRIEVFLRRLATPVIVTLIRGYSYLKEKYVRMIAIMKTVFKRKTQNKNHEQQQQQA